MVLQRNLINMSSPSLSFPLSVVVMVVFENGSVICYAGVLILPDSFLSASGFSCSGGGGEIIGII